MSLVCQVFLTGGEGLQSTYRSEQFNSRQFEVGLHKYDLGIEYRYCRQASAKMLPGAERNYGTGSLRLTLFV